MDTVKNVVKYIIWGVLLYIFVNIASYGFIIKTYKTINDYEILTGTPSIEIIESKATKVNGYIVGKITNNTDALIHQSYVRINFYNSNGNYVGTSYVEINNFQTGKTIEFRTNYRFSDVKKFTMDITDEKVEPQKVQGVTYSPEFANLMAVVGVLLIIWFIF